MNKISLLVLFCFSILLMSVGGTGGCGTQGTTRGLTGTFSASSLPTLTFNGTKKQIACADLTVCCGAYDGSISVTEVKSDCTFKIDLPLDSFCYCAIFRGEDADSNKCPDTYVASLGCSEKGYGGYIPVFEGADDSKEAVDLGSSSVQGTNVVSANDYCASVDEDNDGVANASDSDDDGDAVADAGDFQNAEGCVNADKFDSDANGTPDIYEGLWSAELSALKMKGSADSTLDEFFADTDNDDIPDFCDADFACSPDEEDTDGDCIPDSFDFCSTDADADGVPVCVDCDDADTASGVECYADDFCAIDSDGDGFGLCDDCDDYDANSTYECFGDAFCEEDADADGVGFCLDCDDDDATTTTECYEELADFCNQDNDNDDVGICADCDDFDVTSTTECYDADACATDIDADGVNFCHDCDDFDATVTATYAAGCPVAAGACSITDCSVDFECQLYAEDQLGDDDTGNDICPNEGTSCMTCVDSCCEVTQ
ncbi:MAG: hypothetical protein HYY44_01445 [Deltaproteobacteria bacterium]|nr:hypothetical protein [Deltaproteobacteria bacterium]